MSTTSKSLASDAGRITIFPYVFKPTQGPFSFYANKTRTHTSFWGTYDWPFEMFDPLNRGKPKINTTAAENFINMHEMRHALYEHIAQDTIDENDFSNYAGFLMASSIINDEATTAIVKHRRDYVRAEAKRWSDAYGAPVKIVEPKTFEDLRHVEVQLPQSLFVKDSEISNLEQFIEAGVKNEFPMSDIVLDRLTFTTYQDRTDANAPASSELVIKYARMIHGTVLNVAQ